MHPFTLYTLAGALLLGSGIVLVLTRQNAILVLMGIELMLNAATVNFTGFALADPARIQGQMAALFVLTLAAAETAVALAIILQVYKRFGTVRIDQLRMLKS
ncbi:MAG: NADH-quinone oxidoreductase subunit NuoK [Bacteroidia bacterium]|nr:NADH-quinone oxidoreductase subunit NuoK [Bacteroidia bacterium]